MNDTELRVINCEKAEEITVCTNLSQEDRLRVFRNMAASMMRDALGVWTEIYGELEGSVTHGIMVKPEAGQGFVPGCGWSEFLEKMWLLRHHLDHLNRICEGKA